MENKENYNELREQIRKLGPINEIITNEELIEQIIAYDGDRHLLCALFDEINLGIENNEIFDHDLEPVFRSGKIMDSIINLEETIQKHSLRRKFTSERLDKINYVSLIKDPETLATCYTHPAIIDALCSISQDSNPKDLIWWKTAGTLNSLPNNVQNLIIHQVLDRGAVFEAQNLLELTCDGLTPYPHSIKLK